MLNFQKYFGQNFLIDNNIINKIINIASGELSKENTIIEIGPGKGALTEKLTRFGNNLILIEADKNLYSQLSNNKIYQSPHIKIFNADAVNFDYSQLNLKLKNTIIVSNLPYSCASQILYKIVEISEFIKSCVFMVQKEMAERLIVKCTTKNYNGFTVFLQCFFQIKKMFDISPNCFNPKPKVISSVIKLTSYSDPLIKSEDREVFNHFIHCAFANKRKTLVNSLINNFSIDKSRLIPILNNMNISENARAEQLQLDEFLKLFYQLAKK